MVVQQERFVQASEQFVGICIRGFVQVRSAGSRRGRVPTPGGGAKGHGSYH